MKMITPGHKYVAQNVENPEYGQTIQFIEKIPKEKDSPNLITLEDGTTNEEVLEIVLDRINFLNRKFPCRENSLAITNIEQAIMWLEKRTKDRKSRGVEGMNKQ